MNDYTKKYLRDVYSAFPVKGKNEKRFIRDFKMSITEYVNQHSNCNTDDLLEEFGDPKAIIIDYFNNMSSETYLNMMKRSFYLKISTLVALALMILFFMMQAYTLHLVREEAKDTIIKSEETKIIYE